MRYERVCAYEKCGKTFQTNRQTKKYHSHRCRQADCVARKTETADAKLQAIKKLCFGYWYDLQGEPEFDGGIAHLAQEILEKFFPAEKKS